MSNDFPYGDLIVLAAVAAFIILRLRSTLGKKTGFDVRQQPRKPEAGERIIQLPERAPKPKEGKEEAPSLAEIKSPSVVTGLAAIKVADPSFEAKGFLRGAKIAFEMVFDAFAKGDRKTLQNLLADEVYSGFDEEIKKHESSPEKHETTLISVRPEEITEAALEKNIAKVTVRFATEQISVTRGTDGKITEGDTSQVDEDKAEWSFERDTRSRNPNWKITAT